mmetsp:Transcript_142917/g.266431  ORF Transcript_142917/g.266431 Transcript_142917/m.266431 type:complete len:479 (+) Transcript_142917:60-1496(+)
MGCYSPKRKRSVLNREVEQGLAEDAQAEKKAVTTPGTSGARCPQESPQTRPPTEVSAGNASPAMGKASVTPSEFSWDQVDVIYADDEDLLVDVVKKALAHQGVLDENVDVAKDGLEAMELILSAQAKDCNRPLLLLLDLCMPNMDGHECAERAYEMADKGMLRRPPYVIGCSSHVTSLNPGQFHTVIPKDFFACRATGSPDGRFSKCLHNFQQWWADCRVDHTTRWHRLNIAFAKCLIVDTEPICRMALRMALQKFGVQANSIEETDDTEEALESFSKILAGSDSEMAEGPLEGKEPGPAICRPVMVFLGRRMSDLSGALRDARHKAAIDRPQDANYLHDCEPFIVCVSSSFSARAEDDGDFHCCLPKLIKPDDLCWVLQLFKLWWLERTIAAEQRADKSGNHGMAIQSPRSDQDLGVATHVAASALPQHQPDLRPCVCQDKAVCPRLCSCKMAAMFRRRLWRKTRRSIGGTQLKCEE